MAGNMRRVWCFLHAVACLALAGTAYAALPETLADPTRPPATVAGGDAGAMAEVNPSRLTSVILPKQGGRPSAIIGGQVVPLGGKVGEARLVRVTESGAVLEGPEGVERLYLTPDVEKKTSVTKSAVRRQKDKP